MRAFWIVVLLPLGCGALISQERYCVGSKPETCFDSEAEARTFRDTRAARRQSADLARVEASGAREAERLAARQQELDAEERARAAEREAREARAQARLEEPAYAVPALSALLCERERDLTGYRAELGRLDPADAEARVDIGRDVVSTRDDIAAYQRALAGRRMPCGSVQPVMECLLRSACDGNVAGLAARDLADVARYAPARFGVGLR